MPPHSRFHPLLWLMPWLAALATASAHREAAYAFAILKPIPILLLIACVWRVADRQRHHRATWLLLVGLAFSVQGDVWLLWSQGFLPGLASFWLAHACYLVLFRSGTPPQHRNPRLPAWGCGIAAAVIYTYLWRNGLPTAMRVPVASYTLVIAWMGAQALARAAALRTAAAYSVACGALVFMGSDTILAINKFVQPVPASQLWILGSYYLAQWLIVYGMLPTLRIPSPRTSAVKKMSC